MLRQALLATLASLFPISLFPSPLIVAHRGASADTQENTIPAFLLAWQQGADAIEGDFHLTRDRQIVCHHDATAGNRAGKALTIRKATLAQLKTLDVGSSRFPEFAGARIPTLAEVVTTVPPGKKLFVEIKSSPRIVRHLIKQIDALAIEPEQLVFISFSGRVIKTLKAQRPSLKALLLATPRRRSKSPQLFPRPDDLLAQLRRCQADGLSLYCHPEVNVEFVSPFLAAGYELHTWTVDDPQTAQKWIDLGARSLTTNYPATLKSELAK